MEFSFIFQSHLVFFLLVLLDYVHYISIRKKNISTSVAEIGKKENLSKLCLREQCTWTIQCMSQWVAWTNFHFASHPHSTVQLVLCSPGCVTNLFNCHRQDISWGFASGSSSFIHENIDIPTLVCFMEWFVKVLQHHKY